MELNKFENMIEFNKVKEIWMSFAYTDNVKEIIKNINPYMYESELQSRIRETSESRQMIETCGNPPVVSLSGVDKMKAKADSTMISNKEYMADSFSTIRNGHICIPVKKEYKHKIAGIVIDKSASGNTIFMEPTSSAKYYEELQQLRIEEENEVQRILYELSEYWW